MPALQEAQGLRDARVPPPKNSVCATSAGQPILHTDVGDRLENGQDRMKQSTEKEVLSFRQWLDG